MRTLGVFFSSSSSSSPFFFYWFFFSHWIGPTLLYYACMHSCFSAKRIASEAFAGHKKKLAGVAYLSEHHLSKHRYRRDNSNLVRVSLLGGKGLGGANLVMTTTISVVSFFICFFFRPVHRTNKTSPFCIATRYHNCTAHCSAFANFKASPPRSQTGFGAVLFIVYVRNKSVYTL